MAKDNDKDLKKKTSPDPEKKNAEKDLKKDASEKPSKDSEKKSARKADEDKNDKPDSEGGKESADASGKDDTKDSGKKDAGEGFFSREKKDKKDEKIAELTDHLQRQLAEFDNYRKRTEKEKASMYDMGAADAITKILEVVDNFERGLKGADESDPFVEGMEKVYKQLTKALKDLGVTEIEAEGKEFDPNLHNAVMHEDNPDVGENIVTQELQKGYKYKDTVIRHSMVKVAN